MYNTTGVKDVIVKIIQEKEMGDGQWGSAFSLKFKTEIQCMFYLHMSHQI